MGKDANVQLSTVEAAAEAMPDEADEAQEMEE